MIIGIGTDIVKIERIRRLLELYPGFADKVFTAGEISYCGGRSNPEQSFAARFAAKEALMKALGTGWDGRVNWLDIEVLQTGRFRPEILAHGATKEILAGLGVTGIHLSLSHEKEFALAFVVLERQKT
ncbi:MAG: holo-ACP synthase [Candidatus Syntrophosphaera sp.]|nr:holo-ACP synthase [Candidatus Syntrophosphaera sp.]